MASPLYTNEDIVRFRLKSLTLQPIRRHQEAPYHRTMIDRFFNPFNEVDRGKYANVPPEQDESQIVLSQQNCHAGLRIQASPTQLHGRSRSQYYCQTLRHANDLNNYYNVSNIPSHHHLPMTETPLLMYPNHNAQIDSITVLQHAWNDQGNLDTPPPMPPPRNYMILRAEDRSLYRIGLPHTRLIKFKFFDHTNKITLLANSRVVVLCPSKADRSKLTVCIDGICRTIDIPHQVTIPPSIPHHSTASMAHNHSLMSPQI